MLARFENGYFLEVTIGEDDWDLHQYFYSVFDANYIEVDDGYTEYRSIELYYPMNEIDYILEFCEPDFVEGKYELLSYETLKDYEDYLDDLTYGELDGDWIL